MTLRLQLPPLGLSLTVIKEEEKEAHLLGLCKAGLSDFHDARPAATVAESPCGPTRKIKQLPSEAIEDGLEDMGRSQRKLQWPMTNSSTSSFLRLAR